jgi:tripartite-type tricarboxylate transporter receptor subunit TctC
VKTVDAGKSMTSYAIKSGLAALLLSFACNVAAQNYPNKSILMVVPLPTASATDVVMRIVTQKMSENLGQNIAIENIPGAAGMLGGEKVSRAAPDGYVIGGFSDAVTLAVRGVTKGHATLTVVDGVVVHRAD